MPDYRYEANPPALHKFFGADWEWKWPDEDESLAGDMPTLLDVDQYVFSHLPKNRMSVCVQAGGAVGVWAKRFAQVFDVVYTFEPNPTSFHCLCTNAPELNVVKMNAALGEDHALIRMDFPEHRARSRVGKENIGGYRVFQGGYVPTLRLDDLELPSLDLLFLDIEGYELFAVRGALETIKRCRPYIVLEDKPGCCRQFGYNQGDIERQLLHPIGYRTAQRFHGGRDVLVVPS